MSNPMASNAFRNSIAAAAAASQLYSFLDMPSCCVFVCLMKISATKLRERGKCLENVVSCDWFSFTLNERFGYIACIDQESDFSRIRKFEVIPQEKAYARDRCHRRLVSTAA
jgi:hypothetical protein